MKLFEVNEYIQMKNPKPESVYRTEILTGEDKAKDLGGLFGVLPPGGQVPYHYHRNRDSVLIAISGEVLETVEGKEMPFRAGQVIYIPPGEKHMMVNRSQREFRYLEFFTRPPALADFVEVK
jgi:quercetin dioxygenase-like cupin family protein